MGVIKTFWRRILDYFAPEPFANVELTPQGYYFLEYCRKIASGTWDEENDYVEHHESRLMEVLRLYNKCPTDGRELNRREIAAELARFLGGCEVHWGENGE